MSTVYLLGYGVSRASLETCSRDILAWILQGSHCKAASFFNPHSYAVSKANPRFASALRASQWLLPDGVGVALACGVIARRPVARITGSDLFFRLNEDMNRVGGLKVFFIGSTSQVLATIRDKYARQYPEVQIVGCHAPPFEADMSEQSFAACLQAISHASPDVVYVGMTAPKQEVFIARAGLAMPAKVALGIGAVFDYYAGRRSRASALTRAFGLEWLVRLAADPLRMWRRTLVSAPLFVRDVLWERHEPHG